MNACRVILSVMNGELNASEYVFEKPTRCVIGRAYDCDIQIPMDDEHGVVSRHHCLLDIHPPSARVRDLGSLNGTFVNGSVIGRRQPGISALDYVFRPSPNRNLNDGDELQIGATVFRVEIIAGTDEFQPLDRATA